MQSIEVHLKNGGIARAGASVHLHMHVILHERGQGAEGGTDARREKEAIFGPAILSAQGQQTCLAFLFTFS